MIGVVVLAAGRSRRLGRPKQLVRWRGESLVRRACRLALAVQPDDAVLVVGHLADAIVREVADLPVRPVRAVHWEEGMGSSLREGVQALHEGCTGVVILLCDQYALPVTHVCDLVETWHRSPLRAVASRYGDCIGVPAVLPRSWLENAGLSGERGARFLLQERMDQVTPIVCEELANDLDVPEDLTSEFG
ncbi:nucleotidyltransferase family protein [Tahibacter amnicola]|uniref:Nucleotidyltransferase family protein n=1 Tax=Tahibacter amnicola TaxID=2976241 RepID=A0ABY6BJA1_9GAMM|nr:nucleotidyltransferase family protein [Tahibacter amnicola]UXI68455.1 nucleotidyltransferase family protein [Tahibacter amnicola]